MRVSPVFAAVTLSLLGGCGARTALEVSADPPLVGPDAGRRDAGPPPRDAGLDGGIDGGVDGGRDGGRDGGAEDAGTVRQHAVRITITVDDRWDGWIDGATIGSNEDWPQLTTIERTLGPGHHVLAIRGQDVFGVISALLAVVDVDGATIAVTGDGSFLARSSPPASFFQPTFDDSAWRAGDVCSDPSPWGTSHGSLTSRGARWMWAGDCRSLGTVGFRLHFDLP
ncbi:MAG: hypothetical protein AB7S26_36870 [Sandaracinaceae bacterium]